LYKGTTFDFDELIRGGLFEKDLEKYQKQINSICDSVNKLDKKYPNAKIIYDIFP
jgi:Asp-tRNA(Asn)/Glu-tRNA(Gln) amidotransferase C subunit